MSIEIIIIICLLGGILYKLIDPWSGAHQRIESTLVSQLGCLQEMEGYLKRLVAEVDPGDKKFTERLLRGG